MAMISFGYKADGYPEVPRGHMFPVVSMYSSSGVRESRSQDLVDLDRIVNLAYQTSNKRRSPLLGWNITIRTAPGGTLCAHEVVEILGGGVISAVAEGVHLGSDTGAYRSLRAASQTMSLPNGLIIKSVTSDDGESIPIGDVYTFSDGTPKLRTGLERESRQAFDRQHRSLEFLISQKEKKMQMHAPGPDDCLGIFHYLPLLMLWSAGWRIPSAAGILRRCETYAEEGHWRDPTKRGWPPWRELQGYLGLLRDITDPSTVLTRKWALGGNTRLPTLDELAALQEVEDVPARTEER